MWAVELRVIAGPARRQVLRGLLADALLQARAKASTLRARPLAILAAEALSDAAVEELAEYVRAYGEDSPWGVIDARGRWQFFAEGLESFVPVDDGMYLQKEEATRHSANPFSDLGQWMLKVLIERPLRREAGHELGGANSPIRNVSDLAARASVSLSSASKFVTALERLGYLERSRRGLRLLRLQALLEAWRIASQGPIEERPARLVLPAATPLERLGPALAARATTGSPAGPPGRRACLALFAAAEVLGHGIVRGAPLHLYVETLSGDFLRELDLHPVEHPSDADVYVRRPAFTESVFRGCVLAPNGEPSADELQCWMDLSFHAARGQEQADELAHALQLQELQS